MKHKNYLQTLILVLFCFITVKSAEAQTKLWSMTPYGGDNGAGAIFNISQDGTGYSNKYSFPVTSLDGASPVYNSFCSATNGKLYGMTASGGVYSKGIIFSLDTLANTFSNVYTFTGGVDGSIPYGGLMQANDGKLYGMTTTGGLNNDGVIFSFDPATNTYSKLFDFNGTNGGQPYGNFIQASNNLLYGLTRTGGTTNDGTLFSFNISGNVHSKLKDFSSATSGTLPYGNVIQAINGKLYGLSRAGGANGVGAIFSYDISTNTLSKRFDFGSTTTGRYPEGSLVQAPSGILYGFNPVGGTSGQGVIFSFEDTTSTYTVLHNFSSTNATNGGKPFGCLIIANDGKLYGTASEGLTTSGIIFSYTIGGAFSKLASFNGSNGAVPYAGLLQAPNGKLYGLTSQGGNGYGTVYNYNINTVAITKLVDLNSKIFGGNPFGGLCKSVNGKFYGMTTNGGSNSDGVLFSFSSQTNTYTKLVDLASGSNPSGNLVQASDGKMYGMTRNGGASGQGSIVSYDTLSGSLSIIHSFSAGANGRIPLGSVIQSSNGKLYGMTGYGSTTGDNGVLFSYNISSATYTKLIEFAGATNGQRPNGSLVEANNGKLYGMTQLGGSSSSGVLFSFDTLTNTLSKILDFTGVANGSNPYGNLIQATNGLLYGMTSSGGNNNSGVIFSLDPVTNTYIKIYNFPSSVSNVLGRNPRGSLFQAANGKLYGMTNSGGIYSHGVIFQYDILTSTYSKIRDLNYPDGVDPYYSGFIETEIILSTGTVDTNLCAGTILSVPFNVSDSLNTGNIFTAQLSDESGSFSSPEDIGTIAGIYSGTISCLIPSGTTQGNAYRIRVVSSNPGITGSDNGLNIQIASFRVSLFKESNGSVGGTTAISTHESGNGFDNDGFTMTGTCDIRNTTPSSGYTGASATANVFMTNVTGRTFQIEGINTTGLSGMELSFGIYKNATTSNIDNPVLEVSSNGSSYSQLSYTVLPTGAGTATWFYRVAAGSIPSTANLRIRFTQTAIIPFNQYRIDDIKLTYLSSTSGISVTGQSFICNGNSVSINSTSAASYLWSNGLITQGINISSEGYFYCVLTSENGCKLKSDTITVNDVTPLLFSVTGGGSICSVDSGVVVGLSGSQTGVNYQLKRNGSINAGSPLSGNGSALTFGNQTVSGNYSVVAINLPDSCTRIMDDTVGVTVLTPQTYYADDDNDSYGDPNDFILSCTIPGGYILVAGDCNDSVSTINPLGIEIPGDGIDQDCDTKELCYTDFDDDNYGTVITILSNNLSCTDLNEASVNGDCADSIFSINPGSIEIPGDGIDQDCDGFEMCYTDVDNDNYGSFVTIASVNLSCADLNEAPVNGDCADNNVLIYPGAIEIPADGIDQDCDGIELCYTDMDDDAYGTSVTIASVNLSCTDLNEANVNGDCNDTISSINPGAIEDCCNRIDDNCDSQMDEGAGCPMVAGKYCIGPSALYIPPSGNGYLNGSVPFPTLTAAVSELNAKGACGHVIFEFQNDYTSTAETFPIEITYQGTTTATAVFRPRSDLTDTIQIGGIPGTNGMIIFSGSEFVTIDGSPGGTLDTIAKIKIFNSSNFDQRNILFRNDASNCTINALRIVGGEFANHCIKLGDSTGVSGNEFITISNCHISPGNYLGLPTAGAIGIISSTSETGTIANSNITITRNKIFNFYDGIIVDSGSSKGNWDISSNHFYCTHNDDIKFSEGIRFESNGPVVATISDNYIGGTEPYTGGDWLYDDSQLGIIGISINIKNSIVASTVSGNTIRRFNRIGLNTNSFSAIIVAEGVVNIIENKIGLPGVPNEFFSGSLTSSSFNGIVYISSQNNLPYSISGNTIYNVAMHNANCLNCSFGGVSFYNLSPFSNQITISENIISNVDYHGLADLTVIYVDGGISNDSTIIVSDNKLETIRKWNETGGSFTGIDCLQGNVTLSGNRIGNWNIVNDIWAHGNLSHYGMKISSMVSGIMLNDTVCNLAFGGLTSATTKFAGLYLGSSGSGICSITGCVVRDIRGLSMKSNVETDHASEYALNGILLQSAGTKQVVNNNTVTDLMFLLTSGGNPAISGISIVSNTATTVSGNTIVRFLNALNPIINFPIIIGIKVSSTATDSIYNNMISINNQTGVNPVRIYGIYDNSGAGLKNYHFNSIQIAGTSASSAHSAAFWRNTSFSTASIKNNIFNNVRSGGGKNYAVVHQTGATSNWTSLTSNYNSLYSTNAATLGSWPLGSDKTFTTWESVSGGDANSKNKITNFLAPDDLHLTATSNCHLNGNGTPGITLIDFDGQTRNSVNPDIGADEFTGINPVSAAGPITGLQNVCQGQNGVSYSVPAIAGATNYVWSLPTGASIVSGANSNSITVNYSLSAQNGTLSVYGIDGDCVGISSSITVTVLNLPLYISNSTHTNLNGIVLNLSSTANPYPSEITVSGVSGIISDVNVILSGLSHTFPDDMDLLLESPSGQRIILFSDCGGSVDLVNSNFIINDSSIAYFSDGVSNVSGSYKPTNFSSPDNFPSPGPGSFVAPVGVSSAMLNTFNGSDPNGNWRLYFADDFSSGDNGSLVSWSLEIRTQNSASTISGISTVCQGQTGVVYSIPVVNFATGYNWSLPPGASIVSGANTDTITVDFSGAALSGNITVTPYNSCGNGIVASPFAVTVNNCSSTMLDVKLFIEGYYTGLGLMNNYGSGGCLYLGGSSVDSSDADTVIVSAMDSLTKILVDSVKGILKTDGTITVNFEPPVSSGSFYYIKVNHRNSIETWSTSPVLFTGSNLYDFTISQSQAYGNNMVDVGSVFGDSPAWAIYSGDIHDANYLGLGLGYQDGVIDGNDYGDMETAVFSIYVGYTVEDLTGDGVVSGDDYGLMETNVFYIVSSVGP